MRTLKAFLFTLNVPADGSPSFTRKLSNDSVTETTRSTWSIFFLLVPTSACISARNTRLYEKITVRFTCADNIPRRKSSFSKNYSADTGEEGKKGKINLRPGIEPGTQKLGVQYTKHQAITQDKCLSPLSFLCSTSGRWRICQPHTGRPPNSAFFTCVSRVILTIPSPGELRLPS